MIDPIRPAAALAAWLAAATVLPAAGPDVKHLFPAGGQRGTAVELTVGGALGDAPVSAWCSRPEVTVEIAESSERPQVTIPEDAVPGLCWLRFYNAEGASALKPFFIGTLPEVLEEEPNDALEQAQAVVLPAVVNGVLSRAGDVDTFAVDLQAGQTLVASMEANRRLGSPMDGLLQLVSPSGFVLEQNDDDRGLDPQIVYTAQSDGTYFVRAFAFPAAPNSSVRLAGSADYVYRLTLTAGPFADHAVPLALTRGASSVARAVGWNLEDDDFLGLPVAADGDLTLGDGNLAAAVDASGLSETRLYDARLPDALPLRVVPHAVAVEDSPNGPEHPQAVELPVSISGCIEAPRDVDEYRFLLAAGAKLHARVEARSLGAPLDPVLRLLDPEGAVLQEVDDSTRGVCDGELTFTAESDGEYRIQVFDLHRHGGFRYVYLLTLRSETPDFALGVAADAFRLEPGQPLKVPVTVERTDAFAGKIEVTAVGLPEGVTAAPAVSGPEGDTAKGIELVLEAAGAEGWSGPFLIIGRSADAELTRHAAAPLTGLTAKATALWLTVSPAAEQTAE